MRPFWPTHTHTHTQRFSPFLVWGFYLVAFDVYLGHYFPHYIIVASTKCIFPHFLCVLIFAFLGGRGEKEHEIV